MTLPELKALLEKASPGPWEWWNGCSWWRIGTCDQGKPPVLAPCIDEDGHPNLDCGCHDRDLIVALRNEVPALIARVEAAETIVDLIANGMDAQHVLVRRKFEDWRKLKEEMEK